MSAVTVHMSRPTFVIIARSQATRSRTAPTGPSTRTTRSQAAATVTDEHKITANNQDQNNEQISTTARADQDPSTTETTLCDLQKQHHRLTALRPVGKRIHVRLVAPFMAACEVASARYLKNPDSDQELLNILALVKVGLRNCGDGDTVVSRLKKYPD
ncbi:hypothetical protein V8E36_008747 [Tilletia maclaganii]